MKKCMSVTLYIPCLSAAATGGIDNEECNRPWPDACWPWPNDLGKDTAGNCWSLNEKKNFIDQILFNITRELTKIWWLKLTCKHGFIFTFCSILYVLKWTKCYQRELFYIYSKIHNFVFTLLQSSLCKYSGFKIDCRYFFLWPNVGNLFAWRILSIFTKIPQLSISKVGM